MIVETPAVESLTIYGKLLSDPLTGFMAFFLSHLGSKRAPGFLEIMKEGMDASGVNFRFFVVNSTLANDSHLLAPPQIWREIQEQSGHVDGNTSLAANLLFAINYSLGLPEALIPRWIYRATDDVILNFRELRSWIEELETLHNPLEDWVFLGNVVRLPPGTPGRVCFPQGGSGYLISRFTARQIARRWQRFMAGMSGFEDQAVGRWLLGERERLTPSRRLFGHVRSLNVNLDVKRSCPELKSVRGCGIPLTPVRRLAAAHMLYFAARRVRPVRKTADMLMPWFDADPSLHWYMNGLWPIICRANGTLTGRVATYFAGV